MVLRIRSVVDLADVLSTQSTSDPDVVKGINESMGQNGKKTEN